MRIGQTSIVVFFSLLASSVLGFAATLYFARVLGAEVLGFYSLILVVTQWLKLGGDIGVASSMTKRISEDDRPGAYFTAGVMTIGVLAIGCSGIVFLFRSAVNSYVGVDAALFVILLVFVGLFSSLVNAGLNGSQLVHVTGLLGPARTGLRSLVQILLVLRGYGLTGMILGHAISGLLIGVVGSFLIPVGLKRPRLEDFRSLFDFAKFSWLGSLQTRSFNDVDVLVLGALVSPALVGVYSVVWNLTSFIGTFGSSIRKTTFPELSRADAEEKRDLLGTVITDSLAYNGLIAIPGLFGGILVADRLLLIYGEKFTEGATVLGLLILAMLIYDYQNQLSNALNAIDRPDISFRINLVFVLVNLVLNVGLVLLIGWIGAAIATVLAATVGLLLAFYYINRHLEFDVPFSELGRQVSAAVLMTVVVGSARIGIETIGVLTHNILIVLVLVSLGALTYFLSLLAISERFRSTVFNNMPASVPFLR
jgi:O-antigen/teichoic acid export membrane protein